MQELFLRAVSGLVIVAVIIGSIYFGGWIWFIVASGLGLLSLSEYYRMLIKRMRLSRGVGYICALAILFSSSEGVRPVSIVMIMSLCVYVIFMIEMFRRQLYNKSDAVMNVGGIISGVLFIIVPWTCIILLRSFPTGSLILVTLFACTWTCDVMAYITGRIIGHTLLCENVSAKKTWEGFAGGATGSLLMSALMIYFLKQPPFPLIVIGFICGFAGQLGDLTESIIKREFGEKDSGQLIPGHGGVFDRFDSILLNGLLTYLLYSMFL